MVFERKLGVGEVRNQFQQKLIADGFTPSQAKASANMMSKADIDQVQKDFHRHTKVIIINKLKGTREEVPNSQFDTPYKTKGFLRKLARENETLYEYLTQYLHQGGFLHLAESLMKCFFIPEVVLDPDNRVATFTIEKDGSLSFEEKFDITQIKVPADSTTYENSQGKPLASFSLKSNMKFENKVFTHRCEPMMVKVKDPVAAKFFEDPRNKFQLFLTWINDSIRRLVSPAFREEEEKRMNVPAPRRKL